MASRLIEKKEGRRALRQLPRALQREVMLASQEGGQAVQVTAARLLQGQGSVDSGELLAAMLDPKAVRVTSRGRTVRVGFSKKMSKRLWRAAGWRARFVEHGTVRQPARPFLTPAGLRESPFLRRRYFQGLQAAVAKAGR